MQNQHYGTTGGMNGSGFDEIVPRRGSNSLKWDSDPTPGILPMWVADMDFRTAPPVINALVERARHGIFGYTRVPAEYYEAVTSWFNRRYGFMVKKDWILYTTGVVPALSAVIMALTRPGDKVIVQQPTYNCFFSSVRNSGCTLVSNDLVCDGGIYSIDYDDLERKAADPGTKLMLLCNPHNPVGRVWSRRELSRIGEICIRNNVTVVSDEIHGDLVYHGLRYTPFGSISPEFLAHSVTCTAPGKTFNLAGLQVANIFAADAEIRNRINKSLNINEVCEINPFAIEALIAAYGEGEQWLEELTDYLYENYTLLREFLERNLPFLKLSPLEATYLAWIDCRVLGIPSADIARKLLDEQKLRINEGSLYGGNGEGFIRINLACPRQTLARGLEKLGNTLGCLYKPQQQARRRAQEN